MTQPPYPPQQPYPQQPQPQYPPQPPRYPPPPLQQRPDVPSWAAYAQPMGGFADGHDPKLHQRDWEGQLAARVRGDMPWGFWAFFSGFGSFYLVGLIITATAASTLNFDSTQGHPLGPLLLLTFAPNILLGLFPMIFSWTKGQGLRKDYGIVPKWRDIYVGLAAGAISVGLGIGLNLLLQTVVYRNTQPDQALGGLNTLADGHSIWVALLALFVFVGAPLTEELLVRGALWGALEHHKVHRYAILFLTALIFAFLHQEPERLLSLFCQGLAIGGARMITGRIGSSMVAHATNNLVPALVLFFAS
jgi:uncharacterized protein